MDNVKKSLTKKALKAKLNQAREELTYLEDFLAGPCCVSHAEIDAAGDEAYRLQKEIKELKEALAAL